MNADRRRGRPLLGTGLGIGDITDISFMQLRQPDKHARYDRRASRRSDAARISGRRDHAVRQVGQKPGQSWQYPPKRG